MLVPLNWLADYTKLGDSSAEEIAEQLAGIGLEEEDLFGPVVSGPLVVGRVLTIEPEPQKNGKTINWCSVDVGEDAPRGIVCGAHNFGTSDLVVVALSGAVLPGDFAIAARKTYGHVSDGMICSTKELGLGEDHDGIIVLSELGLDATPGDDAIPLLGLDHTTLDVNVTPDRGYQLSLRGIAREYAQLTGQAFADPADIEIPDAGTLPDAFPVELRDQTPLAAKPGCDRFITRIVRGIDPTAKSPYWMQRRLLQAGMRPISLIVDVTNYVMLALGQPLHAYDLGLLGEKIVVRRAIAGETLTTLDDVKRKLDPEDLLITDETADGTSRIIGLAAVMGGADAEVGDSTKDVVIEAAHFDTISIARSARRHKLSTEASRRFERGVDHNLAPFAAELTVRLLVEYGAGKADEAVTDVDNREPQNTVRMPLTLPAQLVGVDYADDEVVGLLEAMGAAVTRDGEDVVVTPPSWRQDLVRSVDLVEEVARLGGYSRIPSVVPDGKAGAGLTLAQRVRRQVSNRLTVLGLDEVLSYPFTAAKRHEEFGLPADDPRRFNAKLANPLSDELPLMRTTLLATLVDVATRNIGRGLKEVSIFEAGLVTQPSGPKLAHAPRFEPGILPSDAERNTVFAAVPPQPLHYAGVLTGAREHAGWWGKGRPADAADAIELARAIADVRGLELSVASVHYEPWHPGRCAELRLPSGALFGHAGELHPKVCEALELPARAVAFEVNLDALIAEAAPARSTEVLSSFPVSRQDVALIVDSAVPAADVTAALQSGAGELLESIELFDVFEGEQAGVGRKSLAYRLVFRALDRTLTADETSAMRQAATSVAVERFDAVVRGE
ncbi:phenylalanine--tRNA ligase subunit beta [Saxibacter everestensis]|uniref:Phenylalanine--tRNA ligase beta subunit n=1 Tax=Saxibacter everestensis TaxID=2909229 RepID=A0ABY8QVV8_9MICO|nr:phenylalanine--tRNA ligase subunit beta [Brevibacteriaceae bacterium ZFBP1038]